MPSPVMFITGRMPLLASLPRQEVILEPRDDLSIYRQIAGEITEELEYIPGKLFVNRYVRPKYVKGNGDNFIIAELRCGVFKDWLQMPIRCVTC